MFLMKHSVLWILNERSSFSQVFWDAIQWVWEFTLKNIGCFFPYYHQWIHWITFNMESFYCTKASLYWKNICSHCFLGQVHKKVFDEPEKVLQWHEAPFRSFIEECSIRLLFFADEPEIPALHLKRSVTFSFPLRTSVRRAYCPYIRLKHTVGHLNKLLIFSELY